ncbi:MAG TPA: hypothetical protein VF808_10680 [Ktedonobacterales bacterium]
MCRLHVEIWGPAKGSELELGGRASEAAIETRTCAERGLRRRLPHAAVIRSSVARVSRVRGRATVPGYLVSLVIEAPERDWLGLGFDSAALCLCVEAEVAVALLELLNPMVVDGVSVAA